MIIIPAIDIKRGKVVRLTQGKFDHQTIYNDDPSVIAQEWQQQGASLIHVVDLDGAQTGEIANTSSIKQIKKSVTIPIEVGGGIRNTATIDRLINLGVERIILGTRAVEDLAFIKGVIAQWGDRIAISLDCVNGLVAKKGWVEVSDIKGKDLAKDLERLGLKTLIYTDIARDGVLTGPNIDGLKEILSSCSLDIIASGGISSLDDLTALSHLNESRLIGTIVGKALYEHKFTLHDAIRTCSQNA
jgi:phosphoribosylformimino-5-aminoimidazole carboxamide ribotide isomerase